MSCFFHKWSKWETVTLGVGEYVHGGGTALFVRQKRNCQRCNQIDIREQRA